MAPLQKHQLCSLWFGVSVSGALVLARLSFIDLNDSPDTELFPYMQSKPPVRLSTFSWQPRRVEVNELTDICSPKR